MQGGLAGCEGGDVEPLKGGLKKGEEISFFEAGGGVLKGGSGKRIPRRPLRKTRIPPEIPNVEEPRCGSRRTARLEVGKRG